MLPGRVTVYGVVSHTRQTEDSPHKCGNTPSFFTDVDYYLTFIQRTINPIPKTMEFMTFDYPPDEYELQSNGNIFCQKMARAPTDLEYLFDLYRTYGWWLQIKCQIKW